MCEHPTEGKKNQVFNLEIYSYRLGFPAEYPEETKLEREAE